MGRKRAFGWRWRIAGAVVLVALIGGGWGWWRLQHWRPETKAFPVQGVLVGAGDGRADFRAFRAIGARFAYIQASDGAAARDPAFSRNLAAAREAGLKTGAVHRYDPCVPADRQAANFVTIVPRDKSMLPPAIELDTLADDCPTRVSEAAVESELTTFLNEIEGHVGQPAVLKVSSAFEARYPVAATVERNLWLSRDYMQPDYGGRPWTLWTANAAYRNEASETPVRWVVLQP
uniref:glycoside hydrolase family 25 protein n=1 Tax=Altererythrobacter segetis TaxID=1104773 RepID=UPI001407C109|nr:glycoside hydrolase family 25 protein [Altererythrobacter segetis]